jgi:SAM-dependent methyltransferase
VQRRIHQLLIDAAGDSGRLLDVGCGSGQLLIRFAKSAAGTYVGIDHWGDDWEYSQAQAERNAALEGVPDLRFVHGSASRLPFPDGDFGRVVSCMTFHEVRDVEDKIASAGGQVDSSRRLAEILELRFPLNLAKVLKHAVLVRGTKSGYSSGSGTIPSRT